MLVNMPCKLCSVALWFQMYTYLMHVKSPFVLYVMWYSVFVSLANQKPT